MNFNVATLFVSLITLSISTGCAAAAYWTTQTGPSEQVYASGNLAECPNKPNCVSTRASRREQAIVPFTYSKPVSEAMPTLRRLLEKRTDATIVKEDGPYLHVEFRSKVLRFVDDVEFLFDEQSKTLQFRSGSRVGYSDWSVNRQRMEEIRNSLLGKI